MVDILDMEDIFIEILAPYFTERPKIDKIIAHKIILEVADYVEAQQTIACVNCRGYKFKNLKTACQAM